MNISETSNLNPDTASTVTRPAITPSAASTHLAQEVARRRTFAIISHPDAGKTTLTEKLLLYSGAIEQAGAVRARKNQRSVTSDWMAIERERGISITSTALQFEYDGRLFNLLDTPGHQDFSEDTYRTLMAVDSAVMVLDSASGLETQTRKLFTVCRRQQLPILTFINKLDQPGRDPLELIDEIEQELSLHAVPINWPIGNGHDFQGVFDLQRRQVHLFQRTVRGKTRAPVDVRDLDDPLLEETIGERAYGRLREDVELLEGVGAAFDHDRFLAGDLTPVYFGSALNNFGVEPFLAAVGELAPPPRPRNSDQGVVAPQEEQFSGFVFKIQANMDPKHRDCLAFLRVCSGRFTKDMMVNHGRLARTIRMSRPHRLFARDRETVEEAYPGDVIGLSNPGIFHIGDTVSDGSVLNYPPIPPFQPEIFARLRNRDTSKYKQFDKGIQQLQQEGVVQVLIGVHNTQREPILAAVGVLQFDVVLARLQTEYNVEATLDSLPHVAARWIVGDPNEIAKVRWPSDAVAARDAHDNLVVLFASPWGMNTCAEMNPKLQFLEAANAFAQMGAA
ncbi:MAG: peptide chain release factor 3 [Litorilinea sp.]